jgi:hypothetical protein
MTALLLLVVAVEIPVAAALTVFAVHKILLSHQEILARVIARRAADFAHALAQAEARLSEETRTGVRARSGPARLRD